MRCSKEKRPDESILSAQNDIKRSFYGTGLEFGRRKQSDRRGIFRRRAAQATIQKVAVIAGVTGDIHLGGKLPTVRSLHLEVDMGCAARIGDRFDGVRNR